MGLKIKYNSSKVDRSKGNGIPPNPGLYLMVIKGAKFRKDKNDIEFIVRIKDGKFKGYGFWSYVSLEENSDWKVDQYLIAIGVDTVNKPKGSVDLDDFLNQEVMGRVRPGTYNGEPRPELAGVYPVPDDFEEDGDDEDEDEDELEEDEDELEEDEDEDEEEGDDDEDEDEDEDADEDEDDDEVDFDSLGEEADEGDADAIAKLTELAEAADLDPDDYPTWAALAETLEALEEPEEEEEPPPPPAKKATKKAAAPEAKPAPKGKKATKVEYEDMELDDLKAECTKRGISAKGTKASIIARLRANDDDPFSE